METTGHGVNESGDMEGLYDVGFMALLRELVRSGREARREQLPAPVELNTGSGASSTRQG